MNHHSLSASRLGKHQSGRGALEEIKIFIEATGLMHVRTVIFYLYCNKDVLGYHIFMDKAFIKV